MFWIVFRIATDNNPVGKGQRERHREHEYQSGGREGVLESMCITSHGGTER